MRVKLLEHSFASLARQWPEKSLSRGIACATQLAASNPVQLSDNIRLFRASRQILEQVPEVRQQRVQAAKEKLAGGQHEVDSEDLSRLILKAVKDSRSSYRLAA